MSLKVFQKLKILQKYYPKNVLIKNYSYKPKDKAITGFSGLGWRSSVSTISLIKFLQFLAVVEGSTFHNSLLRPPNSVTVVSKTPSSLVFINLSSMLTKRLLLTQNVRNKKEIKKKTHFVRLVCSGTERYVIWKNSGHILIYNVELIFAKKLF